jgi:NACalpha-BTF3-like transcription factor
VEDEMGGNVRRLRAGSEEYTRTRKKKGRRETESGEVEAEGKEVKENEEEEAKKVRENDINMVVERVVKECKGT